MAAARSLTGALPPRGRARRPSAPPRPRLGRASAGCPGPAPRLKAALGMGWGLKDRCFVCSVNVYLFLWGMVVVSP